MSAYMAGIGQQLGILIAAKKAPPGTPKAFLSKLCAGLSQQMDQTLRGLEPHVVGSKCIDLRLSTSYELQGHAGLVRSLMDAYSFAYAAENCFDATELGKATSFYTRAENFLRKSSTVGAGSSNFFAKPGADGPVVIDRGCGVPKDKRYLTGPCGPIYDISLELQDKFTDRRSHIDGQNRVIHFQRIPDISTLEPVEPMSMMKPLEYSPTRKAADEIAKLEYVRPKGLFEKLGNSIVGMGRKSISERSTEPGKSNLPEETSSSSSETQASAAAEPTVIEGQLRAVSLSGNVPPDVPPEVASGWNRPPALPPRPVASASQFQGAVNFPVSDTPQTQLTQQASPESILRLVDMGFAPDAARNALKKCGHNEQAAANWLANETSG
jgi:hypothetical protein